MGVSGEDLKKPAGTAWRLPMALDAPEAALSSIFSSDGDLRVSKSQGLSCLDLVTWVSLGF